MHTSEQAYLPVQPSSYSNLMNLGSMSSVWEQKDWTIKSDNIPVSLTLYNGMVENYGTFYDRFRNDLANYNAGWIQVLDLVQATPTRITGALLPTIRVASLPHVDWTWLNTHMWTTLAYFVTDTVMSRRLQWTHGEEWAGLEWWRAMFLDGKGSSIKLLVN